MRNFSVEMTISYSTGFFHLIFRWYGSIWRSIYKELTVYLVLFFSIRLFYTLGIPLIDPEEEWHMKARFESICRQFNEYTKLIPLTFLLGFYVSNVVSRWWRQFETLNWPEDLLSLLCVAVKGTDERSQQVRHRIARYINVTYALAWRDISDKIRSIFPSIRDIEKAGLLTRTEYDMLMNLNAKEECPYTRWMTPLHWAQQLMSDEVTKYEMSVTYLTNFMSELKAFRTSFRRLFCHDWVCVPLVYTQVAAIATYGFFFFALFGRQHIGGADVDTIFPLFTVVQFLFFVGWYKVGLDLMRPFGLDDDDIELAYILIYIGIGVDSPMSTSIRVGLDLMRPFGLDDDDIELAYILERNINVSFAIVNKLQQNAPPPFEKDIFWRDDNRPIPRIKLRTVTNEKSNQKVRGPKLNTYDEIVDLEKENGDQKKDNGESGGEEKEKIGSFMDLADKVIREERRSRVQQGLNRWLPTWKEDIPKEKKVFYW